MLNDEIIEVLSEKIVDKMELLNAEILIQIGNTIKEIGTLTPSEAQQLINILKYGGSYEKILNKLSEITNLSVKEIDEIFNAVAEENTNFTKQFYKYRNKPFVPYKKNTSLQFYVETLKDTIKQDFLKMIASDTIGYGFQDEFGNIELKGLKETLHEVVERSVIALTQGKSTFNEETSKIIKSIGENGLRTISNKTYVDKNGNIKHYSRRLDSSVRMYMSDMLSDFTDNMQLKLGEDFEADGVEISVHENPAPDHAPLQGHQYSMEEYINIQAGEYGRAIGEYNCYHTIKTIILGVSKPSYTEKELNDIIKRNNKGFILDDKHYTNYDGTQMQRQLETKIREQKDIQILAKASGKDDEVYEAQSKIEKLMIKYKELSDVSGLPTKGERLDVSGYRKVR